LFLGGCTLAKTTPPYSSNSKSVSKANWPEKLRFAVTDLSGLDDLEKDFGEYRQALETVLGIPVEFYPVENYSAAAPALLANELDFAMAGPSEYLLLRARAQAVPIVGVTRPDYYTLIMTRMDSGIDTLAKLKGKKIAMRTEGSTAGHIVPMKLLLDAGVTPGDYDIVMLNRQGFEALQADQVDAWTDSHSRYVEYVKEPGLEGSEIQVIATSDNLPPDVFVANPSLGEDFIAELRSQILAHKETLMPALLSSEANQKYQQSQLIAVQDADYQALRDSYHAIGQSSAIE
ncbi:MAG: PhnD/SsuA/transferrin family substrate-binding protein, partial [Leptolyngbyaceae cyanobacterium MO_188.B28]|nr:PhnD/SsuA/transferrin family substrate-binding protein [Leptolyngbyaceae cyanobacterium MO_188.B28]